MFRGLFKRSRFAPLAVPGAVDLARQIVYRAECFPDSDATPWDDDLACAKAAFAALNVEVRCAPGSWEEAESIEQADRWMRISSDGVEEITWHTS